MVLVAALLSQYRSSSRAPLAFDANQIGGFTQRGLILSSALGLYLELLLIRWISSEIRIFAYLKNFVLIACFLGFGIGCYLGRRAIPLLALIAPLIFFTLLIELPWRALRALIEALPVLLGATSETQIWGVGSMPLTANGLIGLGIAAAVTLPLFALLAITFMPIGQLVGWYLETAPNGITAYTVNVLASLAGIALYTAISFAGQPPAVWLIAAGILACALLWPAPRLRWIAAVAFIAVAALSLMRIEPETSTYWSPYQKLSIKPLRIGREQVGWNLQTNGTWFQKVIDLSPQFVSSHPQLFLDAPIELNSYNIPYRFAPNPESVLILGSGMGNDVAAALRNGAQRVTAVEIDPMIVKLGRKLHPEHPYASPRVHVVVDDARSYIQNADDRFDLIVFSLLDSHTTASHFSNIRIDNYVYTLQALAAAKHLLKPDGIFIVKFQVQRVWIAGRLHDLVGTVFGAEPLQLQTDSAYSSTGRFFVAGSEQRILAALSDAKFRAWVVAHASLPIEHVTLTTDDWPYFYQRQPGVPLSVVTISLLLIIVSVVAAQRAGVRPRSLRLEFFFLGAGFLLLEAQIISRMALLFGTTWLVNSIVIAALLLLIVLANGVAAAAPRLPLSLAYTGLLVAIAIGFVLPIEALLFRSFAVRAVLATLILCAPIFFAGIVFIRRFASAGFSAQAIGSNLLGALAGGILESISLWLGLRSLLLIAMLLYAAAWLSSREAPAQPRLQEP